MKLYFTYGTELKEGYESKVPLTTKDFADESVDEILGEGILERTTDLVSFIEECWRLLRPPGKCNFTSTYYASMNAWVSPLTKRCISEASLNFVNKDWREKNKYTEVSVIADFIIDVNFAIEEATSIRNQLAKDFMLKHYVNAVQMIVFTLTKKEE